MLPLNTKCQWEPEQTGWHFHALSLATRNKVVVQTLLSPIVTFHRYSPGCSRGKGACSALKYTDVSSLKSMAGLCCVYDPDSEVKCLISLKKRTRLTGDQWYRHESKQWTIYCYQCFPTTAASTWTKGCCIPLRRDHWHSCSSPLSDWIQLKASSLSPVSLMWFSFVRQYFILKAMVSRQHAARKH